MEIETHFGRLEAVINGLPNEVFVFQAHEMWKTCQVYSKLISVMTPTTSSSRVVSSLIGN